MRHAVAAWLFSIRPIVGDGPGAGDGSPCAWGWTQIDDACFKVTPGSQSFDSSKAVCASMHHNATVASIVNEDQNQAASNMLSSSAWIGYVVADRSWLDGVQCGYSQDFVEVSNSTCTRLLSADESNSPKWSRVSCDINSPALCSYALQLPRNCNCIERYEIMDGFCNPNAYSSTLCSLQSSINAMEDTCEGPFSSLPDWGRDRWAYLDPFNCNETCIQQKCNKDPACKGYTWAIGRLAASLKSFITGSQPWGGYQCKVKIACNDSSVDQDQASSVSSSNLMMPQVIVSLLLLQGHRVF